MKKIRLVIISEKTRYHFQKPLEYFSRIEIIHLYKSHYPDMRPQEFNVKLVKYKNIFDLWGKLKELKPDLIQGLDPYYGYSRFKIPIKIILILKIIFLFSKVYKVDYFFPILENILPYQKYGFFAGFIMKNIVKIYATGAKFIFYLNAGARQNLIYLNIPDNKISYALWGIWGLNVNAFKAKKENKIINNILFVGRLIEQKGLQFLIDAMPNILNKFPDAKITIVGEGDYKKKLTEQINSLKLEKKCIFLGQKTGKNLIQCYQKADIFVSPSYSHKYSAEQICFVNIEAMSCGLPLVTTRSGSIQEYVVENKNCFLVNEKNSKALSYAIIKILTNQELKQKMSNYSRNYALKRYNAKKNVRNLEKIILEKIKHARSNIQN